jgi:TorA maturation chaperone TorD
MEEEHPQQVREIIPELPMALQKTALTVAETWENALKDRETLALAYARQFLGPFEILTSPYASFYLEPDQRLMSEVSRQVAHFYAEAGLGPGHVPHEAPDHVALEWEFMYYVSYQYVITGEERWIEQRERFRSSHLNHWMPLFAAAMTHSAKHGFYCAVAKFLEIMIRLESMHSNAT